MVDRPPPAAQYRFLEWRYEPERRRLVGAGGERQLKPLLGRLLVRLLDEPDAVLARERLLEEVWTRRHVNDEVLSRTIAELRSLLGDDARAPRFVETLSKGGYRWIAPVVRVEPADVAALEAVRPTARPRRIAFAAAAVLVSLGLALWLRQGWRGDPDPVPGLLDARPLTAGPGLEYDARFDAAGCVAFIRGERQSTASELVLIDPANRAERVLWHDDHALRHPAPAPNGGEIAVARFVGNDCTLWSVALVDARRAYLGDCAPSVDGGLEWVDGGTALLYTGSAVDADHAPGLVRLDRTSGMRRVLTTPTLAEGAHVDPRVSDDGARLVYASRRDGEEQLWQADWPRLRERHALLQRPEPVYGHAFAPRSDVLWVAGDLISHRALHRLREGGAPELLGGRGALSIDLAADGSAVWAEGRYDADIWLRPDAAAPWTAIAVSKRYESQPEFSPDGSRLALVSNRSGTESVFVHDRRDGSTRTLLLDPRYRWVRPTWSVRDDALVLTAYENHRTRLYRYRLDGDTATPVLAEHDAFHGTELADRLIYIENHASGHGTLMQWRDGQAAPQALDLGAVASYRASPRWLVWRAADSSALHAAPWPTLQPARSLAAEGVDEAFAIGGDTLAYVAAGALWRVDLPDGMPQKIATDRIPNGQGPSLALSADGALAVVRLTSLDIDLMIARGAAKAVR